MLSAHPLNEFQIESAHVQIYASRQELGLAAAQRAAKLISQAIEKRGKARVIAGTGNSQIPLAEALVKQPVDWKAVELFHMDEYTGISADHPSSFRYWIKTRLEDKIHPGKMFYLAGDAADLDAEISAIPNFCSRRPSTLPLSDLGRMATLLLTIRPLPIFTIQLR